MDSLFTISKISKIRVTRACIILMNLLLIYFYKQTYLQSKKLHHCKVKEKQTKIKSWKEHLGWRDENKLLIHETPKLWRHVFSGFVLPSAVTKWFHYIWPLKWVSTNKTKTLIHRMELNPFWIRTRIFIVYTSWGFPVQWPMTTWSKWLSFW